MEFKQVKLNFIRIISDFVEIRVLVETYNKKIERERIFLEKIRERLRLNFLKITFFEEEINLIRLKLEVVKDDFGDGGDIMVEFQRLIVEVEEFMLEIEEIKVKVRIVEIRLVVVMKMKEVVRVVEVIVFEEIKVLEKSENLFDEKIAFIFEEYFFLKYKV